MERTALVKILAFGASNSKTSINRALAAHAGRRLQQKLPGATLEVLDLNAYEMPIYSVDRERAGGVPAPARRLFDQLGAADAALASYAEHNGSYTSAWKNIFDWMSRLGEGAFQGRPMVAMAAAPGPKGGATVLAQAVQSARFFGADIVDSLVVARFHEVFDLEAGRLRDPALAARLDAALDALAARVRAPR